MIPVYVDCETTGLDPRIHYAYEYAWAVASDDVQTIHVPHSLEHATPEALEVGRYWDRGFAPHTDLDPFHFEALRALRGATLIGANIPFDIGFMKWRIFGFEVWKYRSIDVESMAIGVLELDEPKGLKWLADELRNSPRLNQLHDQEIPEPDHTAAGDVGTVRAVHLALEQIRNVRLRHGLKD